MGKGTINSHLGSGQYSIDINFYRDRITAEIARIDAEITRLNTVISGLPDGTEKNRVTLSRTALEKRKEHLTNNMPDDETINAWCADLTEDLTGEVGTIEIPGERGTVNIQPGYSGNAVYNSTRDGQLGPSIAGTPEGTFYNLAMLPGWQKWKPTFRYGVITDIDYNTDTCDISLDSAQSSQQSLSVNQGSILENVSIDYLDCNSLAFNIGDSVIIEFINQDFSTPKVVGFKNHPSTCNDGGRLSIYVSCSKSDDIYKFDGVSWTKSGDVGEYPQRMAYYAGKLYVACYDSDDIYVFDGVSWTKSGDVGNGPTYFLEYSGGFFCVTHNKLYKFNESSWDYEPGPNEQIWDAVVYDNKIFFACPAVEKVYVYNGTSTDISLENVDAYYLIVYDEKLYLSTATGSNEVYVFDGVSWTISITVPNFGFHQLVVYSGMLFVSAESVIETRIYVHDGVSWNISGILPATLIFDFQEYDGNLYATSTTGGKVYVFDGVSWLESGSPGNYPYSLGVYNNKLYVTCRDSDDIYVFDGVSWTKSGDVGNGPTFFNNYISTDVKCLVFTCGDYQLFWNFETNTVVPESAGCVTIAQGDQIKIDYGFVEQTLDPYFTIDSYGINCDLDDPWEDLPNNEGILAECSMSSPPFTIPDSETCNRNNAYYSANGQMNALYSYSPAYPDCNLTVSTQITAESNNSSQIGNINGGGDVWQVQPVAIDSSQFNVGSKKLSSAYGESEEVVLSIQDSIDRNHSGTITHNIVTGTLSEHITSNFVYNKNVTITTPIGTPKSFSLENDITFTYDRSDDAIPVFTKSCSGSRETLLISCTYDDYKNDSLGVYLQYEILCYRKVSAIATNIGGAACGDGTRISSNNFYSCCGSTVFTSLLSSDFNRSNVKTCSTPNGWGVNADLENYLETLFKKNTDPERVAVKLFYNG